MTKTTVAVILVTLPIIILLLLALPQLPPIQVPSWMGWPP